MNALLGILAILIMTAVIGCGEQPAPAPVAQAAVDPAPISPPLVGSWKAVDEDGEYIFRADGSGQMRIGPKAWNFTWKAEDDMLLLLLEGDAAIRGTQFTHAFTAEGQLEVWTDDPSKKTRYQRQ